MKHVQNRSREDRMHGATSKPKPDEFVFGRAHSLGKGELQLRINRRLLALKSKAHVLCYIRIPFKLYLSNPGTDYPELN